MEDDKKYDDSLSELDSIINIDDMISNKEEEMEDEHVDMSPPIPHTHKPSENADNDIPAHYRLNIMDNHEKKPVPHEVKTVIPEKSTLRDRVINFMRETYPIFEAGIKNGVDPFFFAGDGQLPKALKMTLDLSTKIAKAYSGTNEPTGSEKNAFRYVASLLISEIMSSEEEDAEDNFNADDMVKDIANAFKQSKEEISKTSIDTILDDESQIAITSMKISSMLITPVLIYDFRQNKIKLIGEMCKIIVNTAIEKSNAILPHNTDEYSRWKILDTMIEVLTRLMAKAYEKQAIQFTSFITTKTEPEKREIFDGYDPIKEINRTFEDYATLFSSTTVMYTTQLMAARRKKRA